MDDLGLVEAIDRFREGIVVAIADAADRRLDACFREALGILDRDVLGGFTDRRNTLAKEVAMQRYKRRSDRCVRAALRSPGRPPEAQRESCRQFWIAIASGRSSEDAAVDARVSPAVGVRWFRRAGGVPPTHFSQSSKPPSGRYLSFAEREEIAILRAQGQVGAGVVVAADQQKAWVMRVESLRRASKDGLPFATGPSLGRAVTCDCTVRDSWSRWCCATHTR